MEYSQYLDIIEWKMPDRKNIGAQWPFKHCTTWMTVNQNGNLCQHMYTVNISTSENKTNALVTSKQVDIKIVDEYDVKSINKKYLLVFTLNWRW